MASCTRWREEERKDGLLFKSVFCGPQVDKTQVKATGELRAKKPTGDKTSAERGGSSSESERKHKVQGWLPHTAQTKMQAKFSWKSKYNKYKNKQ